MTQNTDMDTKTKFYLRYGLICQAFSVLTAMERESGSEMTVTSLDGNGVRVQLTLRVPSTFKGPLNMASGISASKRGGNRRIAHGMASTHTGQSFEEMNKESQFMLEIWEDINTLCSHYATMRQTTEH